jgi:hypothetical protein
MSAASLGDREKRDRKKAGWSSIDATSPIANANYRTTDVSNLASCAARRGGVIQ